MPATPARTAPELATLDGSSRRAAQPSGQAQRARFGALALLNDTLDELAADDALRALVLSTTTSGRCAPAPTSPRRSTRPAVWLGWPPSPGMYAAIDAFPVPVVAVCVGNCVGAGAEIVAGSDLRVGGDNLKLAWAGARLGVPVGPARLTPLIGVARAKDLVFTGRTVGTDEAARSGCCTASRRPRRPRPSPSNSPAASPRSHQAASAC